MPGLLDYWNRGTDALAGQTGNYGGLLSAEDQQAAQQQARMALAAQLLDAGGYSQQRVGLGQALGRGMGAAQQARQGSVDQSLQAKLLMKQLQSAQQQSRKPIAIMRDGKPVYVTEEEAIGGEPYSPMQRSEAPAVIQEYELYTQQETAAGRKPEPYMAWLSKRASANAQSPFSVVDLGGGKFAFDKRTSGSTQLTTPEQEAAGAGTIEGAKTGAKTTAEATAQAQLGLPGVVDKANEAIGLIDELRKHPGRKQATGASRLFGVQSVPGTDAYDFEVMRKQVGGQQFLQAFETLKGAGQITEVEGTQAKEAIARMDAAQSEGAYMKALDDYEKIIKKGVERSQRKAAGKGYGADGLWDAPSDSNVVEWNSL
jgi:hypothetical protein